MRILLFHPVLLPPRNYGGVERMVLWLAQGLRDRGHEVWIAAKKGSELPESVRLLSMSEPEIGAIDLLKKLPPGMDVIHFMAPPEEAVWEKLPCAGVLTVHGNGKPGERFPLNTVFLTQDHALRHGANVFVYNGIDPAEYQFEPELKRKENGYLFLSKTSWKVKNLVGAMRICARANVSLSIAGGSRPIIRRIEAQFRPKMKWIGPVNGKLKAQILAQSRALLFPVLWPEPFGLVVVEALMSGTPVIASKKGSLPELLPPDVGALLESPVSDETETQWVNFLQEQRNQFWNPERCRSWALEKFHYSQMAEGYEALYKRVIQGEQLHNIHPIAGDWRTQ